MRTITFLAMFCALGPIQAQDSPPIKLTLHPAPPTTSALKYRLLPELRDMHTGNAAVYYLRAMSPEAIMTLLRKENQDRDDKVLQAPIEKTKTMISYKLPNIDQNLEDGAISTFCDWQYLDRARKDGLRTLLPDTQTMRVFGKKLAASARISIANGNFDDAHRSLSNNLAMARHVCDNTFLVHCLVGIDVAMISTDQFESWIGQPNAPNLYWPLTDLPQPLIDLRRGFEADRLMTGVALPDLRTIKPGEFRFDRERFDQATQYQSKDWKEQVAVLFARANKNAPAARAYVKKQGWSEAQAKALTAQDAVVLHQLMEYNRVYEDIVKTLYLPVPLALELNERIANQLASGPDRPWNLTLAGLFLDGTNRVYITRLRLDRRLAALRTIEAIRLHVTEKGKMPEKLDEVTIAPIPSDPLTGKPFDYRKEGTEFRLTGPPSPRTGNMHEDFINYTLTAQ